MQNEKVKRKKKGFWTWPNMALTNMDKRRPNLVSKRERTVERERREEEKREEEKKRRRDQAKRYGN